MTLLPTFRDDLAATAERLERRRAVRRRGTRLAGLLALASAGLGGIALAAGIVHWTPSGPSLRITTVPPPADQQAALGVLRRPQRASDRTALALRAMRTPRARAGIDLGAVRADSVRVLAVHGGVTLVLVPRTFYRSEPGRPFKPRAARDVLCIVAFQPAGAAGTGCSTTADVEAGRVGASLGRTFYALVPDRVTALRVETCAGPVRRIPVRSNLALLDRERGWAGYGQVRWLDRSGRIVGRFAGLRDACVRRTQ